MSPKPDLARMIRDEYARRGITQTEAAEACGVKQQTFSRWASGKLTPSPDALPKLARFLHITLAELRSIRAEAMPNAAGDQVLERLGGIEATLKALAREVRRLADDRDS